LVREFAMQGLSEDHIITADIWFLKDLDQRADVLPGSVTAGADPPLQ
jgi:hypothetical protein